MGPAYGRDPRDAWRRSRCGSLATLPMGRVSSASAHAGPARRTAALDGFQRSPSLRRGRRAVPLAPGRRAPSCDAPQGRVSSASAQPSLTRPGSRCPWQPARSVRARYGFRCTESSCPPVAGRANRSGGRSRRRAKRGSGRLLRPGPKSFSPRALAGSPGPGAQAPRTPASPSLSRAA